MSKYKNISYRSLGCVFSKYWGDSCVSGIGIPGEESGIPPHPSVEYSSVKKVWVLPGKRPSQGGLPPVYSAGTQFCVGTCACGYIHTNVHVDGRGWHHLSALVTLLPVI